LVRQARRPGASVAGLRCVPASTDNRAWVLCRRKEQTSDIAEVDDAIEVGFL
jgi:hypothetical protein